MKFKICYIILCRQISGKTNTFILIFFFNSQELANEYPDVVMLKVDVDECEEAAIEYNIQSMPTFVFLKSKQEVKY